MRLEFTWRGWERPPRNMTWQRSQHPGTVCSTADPRVWQQINGKRKAQIVTTWHRPTTWLGFMDTRKKLSIMQHVVKQCSGKTSLIPKMGGSRQQQEWEAGSPLRNLLPLHRQGMRKAQTRPELGGARTHIILKRNIRSIWGGKNECILLCFHIPNTLTIPL